MSFLKRLKASYLRAFLCIGLSVVSMLLLNPNRVQPGSGQFQKPNCAVHSLYAACKYLDIDVSLSELSTLNASSGSTILELVQAASDIGLKATGIEFDHEDLMQLPRPFIAHFSEGHFVFVKSIHEGQVQIVDNGREATMDINQFMQRSSGNAVLFKHVKG